MAWNPLTFSLMTNKLLSVLIALLLSTTALHAQTYTVYSIVGNARIVDGKKTVPLTVRKQLNKDSRLYIGTESAVTLIDEKRS